MESIVLARIEKWKNSPNLEEYLKEELDRLSEDELFDAFYKDLEFGTGGMRGVIGVGTNRMNIYTLRSANYGYQRFINRDGKEGKSVVIAYDCRRRSLDFAKESARVLAKYGIKVYLFDKITPTPELSFAVRYLKADGGIVVTASHNPPEYNGYKIYDNTGCQLVPDLAQIVIDEIKNSPDPFEMQLDSFDELKEKGLVEIIGSMVDDAYLKEVKSIQINPDLSKDNFLVTFTSLHGTSSYLGQKLLTELGYNFDPVKEQMIADSEFSTVKSPNPENKEAFDLAIEYAKRAGSDIIIATDPDADRVGLAVKDKYGYTLLTGNQTGALLINYLCECRKIDKKGVVFNTIVTSMLGANIALKHGMEYFSTLTGFKYIGEQATKLENSQDKMFYFGYEESYGYVVKDFVRDKDSLQALLLCSEMANYYKKQGLNVLELLDRIYKEYGYFGEDLVNISLKGQKGAERIVKVLDYFRGVDKFDNKLFDVTMKEDYELSIRKDFINIKEEEITLPKSNVIKYFLSDGSWFVLRPSGTEPKMKVYLSSVAPTYAKAKARIIDIKKYVLDLIDKVE